MKGKQPKGVDALRSQLLADETSLTEYAEQRVISQLGGLVNAELEARHISQGELSRNSGIAQPDINLLVRGRAKHIPTVSTIRRLSRGLDRIVAFKVFPSGEVTVSITEDQRVDRSEALQETYSSSSS